MNSANSVCTRSQPYRILFLACRESLECPTIPAAMWIRMDREGGRLFGRLCYRGLGCLVAEGQVDAAKRIGLVEENSSTE